MSLSKLTNTDIVKTILAEGGFSAQLLDTLPKVTDGNIKDIGTIITTFPNDKNAFLTALTNKVGRSIFFGREWENPFALFEKGMLPFGTSIEAIFADIVKAKSSGENFKPSGGSDVDDLVGYNGHDNIKVEYWKQNFEHVWNESISDIEFKKAFYDQYGLDNLISKKIQSIMNSKNKARYEIMTKLLGSGKSHEISLPGFAAADRKVQAEDLTIELKTVAGDMKFLKSTYNGQGVNTFTNPSDCVIILTPRMEAIIDVSLLATSFNLEKASLPSRVITIDQFVKWDATANSNAGGYVPDTDTVAMVVDMDYIQFFNTVNESRTFENGRKLHTNFFWHDYGIANVCNFANAVKFKAAPKA